MSLDLIPKARSKDDCTQAYSYAKQCGIRNKLHTTSKPTSTSTFTPNVGLGPIPTLQSLTRL